MKLFTIIFSLLFLMGCGSEEDIGEELMPGTTASIIVDRGSYGQPKISVQNAGAEKPEIVLARAQGNVEAKDRFLQMDLLRRASTGKLAELFGEDAYPTDLKLFSTGLPLATKRTVKKLEALPEIRDMVTAYVEGVNHFISNIETLDPDLLRKYRRLTKDPHYLPAPWKFEDSVAIAEGMAFALSSSLEEKLIFGVILLRAYQLNFDAFLEDLDLRPLELVSILPPKRAVETPRTGISPVAKLGLPKGFQYKFRCTTSHFQFPVANGCLGGNLVGSNNWAVSKRFHGGTKTYLANDPHLSITFPSTMNEILLRGGSIHVAGMSVPGTPGVLIGHNVNIGFVLTNSMTDVGQLFIETLDPKTRSKVWAKAPGTDKKQWFDLVTINETIKVRGDEGKIEERKVPFRYVQHGGDIIRPILSDHYPGLELPPLFMNTAISYQWVGHSGSTEMAAVLGMNRAQNFQEFKEALGYWEAGAQNVVYGDRQGNIGYYSHGRFPLRAWADGSQLPPYFPVSGEGDFEWTGYRTVMPELYNPPTNKIVTANQDPYGYNFEPNLSQYRDYFGYRYAFGSRAKRIHDLLDAKAKNMTVDSHREILFDHLDYMAKRFVEDIVLKVEGEPAVEIKPEIQELIDALKGWDFKVERDSTEPVLFFAVAAELMRGHFPKLEGEKDPATLAMYQDFYETATAVKSTFHKLRDGLSKETLKTKNKILEALTRAQSGLSTRKLINRRWGSLHRLQFYNMLPGVVQPLGLPQVERDGSWGTVDVGGFSLEPFFSKKPENWKFPHYFGPNFRMILVLEEGQPIKGYNVIPGGTGVDHKAPSALHELFMWRDGKDRDLVYW